MGRIKKKLLSITTVDVNASTPVPPQPKAVPRANPSAHKGLQVVVGWVA